MTERIDHAAEARNFLEHADTRVSEEWPVQTGEHKADVIARAQVHATLALVEQQRIANLIALASLPKLDGFENEVYDVRLDALMSGVLDRREVPAVPGYGPAGIDEQTFIRPEIAAALGLDQIGETR